jgi:hypothetical protein
MHGKYSWCSSFLFAIALAKEKVKVALKGLRSTMINWVANIYGA